MNNKNSLNLSPQSSPTKNPKFLECPSRKDDIYSSEQNLNSSFSCYQPTNRSEKPLITIPQSVSKFSNVSLGKLQVKLVKTRSARRGPQMANWRLLDTPFSKNCGDGVGESLRFPSSLSSLAEADDVIKSTNSKPKGGMLNKFGLTSILQLPKEKKTSRSKSNISLASEADSKRSESVRQKFGSMMTTMLGGTFWK